LGLVVPCASWNMRDADADAPSILVVEALLSED
jgi:hypothetical protein